MVYVLWSAQACLRNMGGMPHTLWKSWSKLQHSRIGMESMTMENGRRPVSVTVIGWIIILFGVLSFWFLLRPTIVLNLLWGVIHGTIALASGIAMLRGLNWGRLLYLLYVPVAIILRLLLYGFFPLQIVTVIWYVAFLILLTRPAASAFFAQQHEEIR
jgi:hypothetical protein